MEGNMKYYRHNPFICVLSMFMLFESIPLVAQAEFPLLRSSSSQEIKYFLTASSGSTAAKMVFVNSTNGKNGQLCYIDFSEVTDTPVVHSIAAVVNAKVPVISPDGQWVVYDTGTGGEAGSAKTMRSSVFICKIAEDASPVLIKADSACEPRFMQNVPQGLDTIIYSTLLPDFGWQDSGKTMKVGVDVTNGTPLIGTPQLLWDKGGYSGGQSWNKRFLCGGGGSVAMLDTKGTGKPDTITSYHQACNVSISASRLFNDRAMYLTSGDHDAQIKPDSIWRQWQIIFISDLAREVVRYYRCPTKFKFDPQTPDTTIRSINSAFFWHHPEWSNHPYLAASTVNIDRAYFVGQTWKHTDYQERLYIVNLKDSVYLEILRPQPQVFAYNPAKYSATSGILWPWLWVQVPKGFQEDTAWLKKNRPSTGIRDVKYSNGHNPLIKLSGNSLTAISPIARISIYDISGRKTASLCHTFINGKSADLSSLSGNCAAVRFIRIECVDGTSAVIKSMRIRND
jgi:hypothetical protein